MCLQQQGEWSRLAQIAVPVSGNTVVQMVESMGASRSISRRSPQQSAQQFLPQVLIRICLGEVSLRLICQYCQGWGNPDIKQPLLLHQLANGGRDPIPTVGFVHRGSNIPTHHHSERERKLPNARQRTKGLCTGRN